MSSSLCKIVWSGNTCRKEGKVGELVKRVPYCPSTHINTPCMLDVLVNLNSTCHNCERTRERKGKQISSNIFRKSQRLCRKTGRATVYPHEHDYLAVKNESGRRCLPSSFISCFITIIAYESVKEIKIISRYVSHCL